MKNEAKKIIAIGSGVCFLALEFVFLLFATKPYTEKIVIWLPNNYELENNVKDEVISILSQPDEKSHRSNSFFYATADLDSFKELAGKSDDKVSVRIKDESHPGDKKYRIVYQIKYCNNNKDFIIVAQEYHEYNRMILSEMRLRDGALFLKYNRNTKTVLDLSIIGFFVVAGGICSYMFSLSSSKPLTN